MEAWDWAYNNATYLSGDQTRYFTIGQSAGGTIALAVVRRLVSLGRECEVRGIAAIVPFVVHPEAVPARYVDRYRAFEEFGDGPVNTGQAMSLLYDTIHAQHCDPYIYVLNAESELHRFPPAYLAVCEIDPLRDDGLMIHDALKASGYVYGFLRVTFHRFFFLTWLSCRVPVKLHYYKALPHVFWAFVCPAPSGDFVSDVVAGIKAVTHF
ncbi:hypothetical protein APSETT444_010452 [Aspergillus pseudonomiae]